mgnify:CR=1 FL=1
MAIPLDNRQISNVVATTIDVRMKDLVDNHFNSNPLFVRLRTRGNIDSRGGEKIRRSFVYAGLGGGSYGKGDTFDTSYKEYQTDLLFDWKRNYAPLAIDGLDVAKNEGAHRVRDITNDMMDVAELTLADNIGGQIYGDGTGNASKDLDGLAIAVSTTGTYGGIARAATGPGNKNKGNVNSTGGALSLSMIRSSIGDATIQPERTDLIITTQDLWDKLADRVDARQQTGEGNDMKKVGISAINFDGADVVVDSHVASGEMWGLNTKYVEYWVLTGHDFQVRGLFDLHNEDGQVGQIIVYSNLVVRAPRLQWRIQNIT